MTDYELHEISELRRLVIGLLTQLLPDDKDELTDLANTLKGKVPGGNPIRRIAEQYLKKMRTDAEREDSAA